MRVLRATLCLLLASPALTAAPAPSAGPALGPAAREQLRAESLNYAQQLLSVASQISLAYVRPVSRADLLHAGLSGLFEEGRQPAPPGLRAELHRRPDDTGLIEFLIQTRERLGACDELREPKALLVSCQAMMKLLDPYCAVVTEEGRKDQPWGDQPVGIGLELEDNAGVGPLRIRKVHPGGPAQKAGLLPGDVLTHIDTRPIKRGTTSAQAAGLLHRGGLVASVGLAPAPDPSDALDGRPLRPVRLTVSRPGRKPWNVALEFQTGRPESVLGVVRSDNNSWDFFLDRTNKIAHVRIAGLNRGVADDLREVLERHEEALRGLILDLRWCPGGFLDEALGIAGLFLGDVVLATVTSRNEKPHEYHNLQPKRFLDLPVVVLVNGQTSGGAELIAAALQDHKRAAVAGQRTRGKTSVQTTLFANLPGATIRLTSGEFIRPGDKEPQPRPAHRRSEWRVWPSPDLEYRVSADFDRRLREGWEQQTLRPGTSTQALPLDDPASDPQREVARRGVLEAMKKAANRRKETQKVQRQKAAKTGERKRTE
ncbi:MAG: PDZ domain-containing protein [Planctomycetes bacterium]|nr:PDZ domain-containing protein [Planctomycetota bacterium]